MTLFMHSLEGGHSRGEGSNLALGTFFLGISDIPVPVAPVIVHVVSCSQDLFFCTYHIVMSLAILLLINHLLILNEG